MKLAAIIIENRYDVTDVISDHKKFLPESFDMVHIKDESIKSEADYNRLMTSKSFWDNLPYDKVLIFQHDSRLLRTGIEEFYPYDFIGAPLYHIPFPAMNGGLSLRSVKAMREVLSNFEWNWRFGNEDVAICNLLNGNKKYNLPSKEIAQKFSVETIFSYNSMGVHAIEKWHHPNQVEELLNQYK